MSRIEDWASHRWDRRATEEEPSVDAGGDRYTLSQAEADLELKRAELLSALGSTRRAAKLVEEFEAVASLRGLLVGQILK